MNEELRLKLDESGVTNDVVALTLTESELQILWKLIKNEWTPHDVDAIRVINKISAAANRREE